MNTERWISTQGRDGYIYLVTPAGYLVDAIEYP